MRIFEVFGPRIFAYTPNSMRERFVEPLCGNVRNSEHMVGKQRLNERSFNYSDTRSIIWLKLK